MPQLLERLTQFSRFAKRTLEGDETLAEELAATFDRPFSIEEMAAFLDRHGATDEASLKAALRRLRRRVILRVMARDVGARASLPEVAGTMSALADACVRVALARITADLAATHGTPIGEETAQPQELIVIGMGKLGGHELNVSSDIDLIFVFPEQGETSGARRISNQEFFEQAGRKLIGMLSEHTADGYVFRVDMRLRPYGDSGPLAMSFGALDEYLVTQGRPWERYAWIKARAITGNRADELQALIRPFVYRRYLDFTALASLRDLHRQVRAEVMRKERLEDIKLGPGGIREIEFVAQVFQLIRGGRELALQERATLPTLARLAEMQLLSSDTAGELSRAYVFLRNLEHRLQYLDDAQTQTLPTAAEDRDRIAKAMGFSDYTAFHGELERHRALVTRHFDAIFAGNPSAPEHAGTAVWRNGVTGTESEEQVRALGYRDPAEAVRRLQAFRNSSKYRQLPDTSRSTLDALVPNLITEAAALSNPDQALISVLELLETISRRGAYLSLLAEHPPVLSKVAALACKSRWAMNYLKQHPIVLDEFLDHRELLAAPNWPRLRDELLRDARESPADVEQDMVRLRHVKQAHMFHLIAQDLEGLLTVEKLSDHLSDLADLLLGVTLAQCWRHLPKRHRTEPVFAVIGYGKLGGKELGYGSDLDIVFLYDDDHADAPETYARLAQRMNTWLTAYTAGGMLYDTDLRLRPDGASGLLVSTVQAFDRYQHEQAWTWEHQALTRARFCAGDASVGKAFDGIRTSVLCQPRDANQLRRDIIEMRDKMRREHQPKGGFEVKHSPGGLIDVEFVVQYLVLAHADRHPALTDNIGNIALLHRCASLGLLGTELADGAASSYRQLRAMQHRAWMNGLEPNFPVQEVADVARPIVALWRAVMESDPV